MALPLLHFDTSPPAWSRQKRYVGTLPPTSHPRRSVVVSHAGSPRVDDADGIANLRRRGGFVRHTTRRGPTTYGEPIAGRASPLAEVIHDHQIGAGAVD